jgi:hypothetical protein
MSVVLMSKRELSRLDVLAHLDGDRLTVLAAATALETAATAQQIRTSRPFAAAQINQ